MIRKYILWIKDMFFTCLGFNKNESLSEGSILPTSDETVMSNRDEIIRLFHLRNEQFRDDNSILFNGEPTELGSHHQAQSDYHLTNPLALARNASADTLGLHQFHGFVGPGEDINSRGELVIMIPNDTTQTQQDIIISNDNSMLSPVDSNAVTLFEESYHFLIISPCLIFNCAIQLVKQLKYARIFKDGGDIMKNQFKVYINFRYASLLFFILGCIKKLLLIIIISLI